MDCNVYLAALHPFAKPDWAKQIQNWLNGLCAHFGALKVGEG